MEINVYHQELAEAQKGYEKIKIEREKYNGALKLLSEDIVELTNKQNQLNKELERFTTLSNEFEDKQSSLYSKMEELKALNLSPEELMPKLDPLSKQLGEMLSPPQLDPNMILLSESYEKIWEKLDARSEKLDDWDSELSHLEEYFEYQIQELNWLNSEGTEK